MGYDREPLLINGAHGEGGSLLLRTAFIFSALTQQPICIENVRARARKAGLTFEDLNFVRTVATCCSAKLIGDDYGSDLIEFYPSKNPRNLDRRVNVTEGGQGKVPGNAVIFGQALLPLLAKTYAVSTLSCVGETHNPNALSYDVLENVTLAAHRAQGLYASVALVQAGYGFGTQGEFRLEVEPSVIEPVVWEKRGEMTGLRAQVTTSSLASHVSERAEAELLRIAKDRGLTLDVETIEVKSRTPGAFVSIWAEFESGMGSGAGAGRRGLKTEDLVQGVFEQFLDYYETDACVDEYLADQLLPVACLADEKSVYTVSRVSQRLTTAAWVIKQLVPIHITIREHPDGTGTVSVSR